LAYRKFSDLGAVDYQTARTTFKEALASKNRLDEVRLAKSLADRFRVQYRQAAQLAKEGK
jgi:hypothetical protein